MRNVRLDLASDRISNRDEACALFQFPGIAEAQCRKVCCGNTDCRKIKFAIRSIDFRRLEAPAVGHFHNDWTPLTDDMQAGGDQPIRRDHKSRPPGIDDFKWLQDRPTVAKSSSLVPRFQSLPGPAGFLLKRCARVTSLRQFGVDETNETKLAPWKIVCIG